MGHTPTSVLMCNRIKDEINKHARFLERNQVINKEKLRYNNQFLKSGIIRIKVQSNIISKSEIQDLSWG